MKHFVSVHTVRVSNVCRPAHSALDMAMIASIADRKTDKQDKDI